MRKILGPLALLVAVVGAAPSSFAQSAYDYPWCSIRGGWGGGGGQSCYFTSHAQCMASISGIGGTCIQNPGYRGPEVRTERRFYRY
jgi:hypothetical protein